MPPLTLLRCLKPCSRRKCTAWSERTPDVAVDVVGLVRVQLGEALRQRAERQQRHAIDAGDLLFVGLAHVEDLDAELWVVQRAFQFLHGDFVGMQSRGGGFGRRRRRTLGSQ